MTKCKNKRPINCLQAHPKCFQYLFHLNIMSPCPTNCINIIGGLVVSQNQKNFGSLLFSTLLDQKFGGASCRRYWVYVVFYNLIFVYLKRVLWGSLGSNVASFEIWHFYGITKFSVQILSVFQENVRPKKSKIYHFMCRK